MLYRGGIVLCEECGSTEFQLRKDRIIECAGCLNPLSDIRWWDSGAKQAGSRGKENPFDLGGK